MKYLTINLQIIKFEFNDDEFYSNENIKITVTIRRTATRETSVPIGIIGSQLRTPLKHPGHHSTMTPRGSSGALNFSFDSAVCAFSMKIGAKLKGGGEVSAYPYLAQSLKTPLKPLLHHSTMIPRGLSGALNWAP